MSRRILLAVTWIGACLLDGCRSGEGPAGGADVDEATPTPTALLGAGGGHPPPGAEYSVELKMTYILVPTIGTDQPVVFSMTIPLSPVLTATNRTASGDGEILEDIPIAVGPVTVHNVADWIIHAEATFDPNLADEPLSVRFASTGQGYGSVEQVQVGAHMDAKATT